jgi:hypothetical protein
VPLDVNQFKGEAPRIAPRLLPSAMGQNSENARVISGNLEAWAGFADGQAGQVIVSVPVTIWYMNDQLWLSWSQPTSLSATGLSQAW